MIDSYDKLTVGKYQTIKAIIDNGGDETEIKTEVLSELTEIDVEDLLDMPIVRYHHLLQNAAFLLEDVPHRMVATKYILGGVTFDVLLNIEKMTAAQFIDYQNYIKDVNGNLVQLLSVFLIPKGHRYNEGYDIVEMQKIIKDNLCIIDAYALAAFFLKWYESLLKATVHSLIRQMKRILKKEKDKTARMKIMETIANLEKSGSGLVSLTE